MAIKELKELKVPSETDVTYTLPKINEWRKYFTANLCSRADKDIQQARNELLNEAIRYTNRIFDTKADIASESPVIGTGHQATWHHCGILVKDIISEAFSKHANATNLHIVLDHDIQEPPIQFSTTLKSNIYQIKFETSADTALEFKKFNTASINLSEYPQNAFCRRWDRNNTLTTASRMSNISDATTYLQGTLKNRLGIKPLYLPVSKICKTNVFELFLENILDDARRFLDIYNNAILSLGRKDANALNNIKRLGIENNKRIALPFWLLSSSGKRHSLWITINHQKQSIYADNNYICDHKKDSLKQIASQGYHVRPKAITLMLFLRLYLFDWFIHGVGGGKYEVITDNILEAFYCKDKTYYGIATLTAPLLVNDYSVTQANGQLQKLTNLSRQIRFNPERFYTAKAPPMQFNELIQQKKTAIKALENTDISKNQKALLFKEIAKINLSLLTYVSDEHQNILSKLNEERSRKLQVEMDSRRDHFFGLFSEERLTNIVRKTFEDEYFKQTEA